MRTSLQLIALLNDCGVRTVLSCQDNNAGCGSVRRVWVEVLAEDLPRFLELIDRPGEIFGNRESLSNRIAAEP